MRDHKNLFSIGKMANVFKVSRSGYYKYMSREPSQKSLRDDYMKSKIEKIYEESDRTYGSPRIHKELQEQEIPCGKNQVARLMKEMHIKSKRSKKRKVITTDSSHNYPISPNLLDRNFAVSVPNKVWVSDITYIATQEGWLYLCIVLDLFSRMIVGWSMSDNLKSTVAIDALDMAYNRRNPSENLIFHSDRGIQYASSSFREKLKEYKMLSSMSKTGDCWDNACAESFFSTLKMERIYHKRYGDQDSARKDIFEYIEMFYNVKRRHSTIGYMSPMGFELKYVA